MAKDLKYTDTQGNTTIIHKAVRGPHDLKIALYGFAMSQAAAEKEVYHRDLGPIIRDMDSAKIEELWNKSETISDPLTFKVTYLGGTFRLF